MSTTTITADVSEAADTPPPAVPRHMALRLVALCCLVALSDLLFLTHAEPGLSAALYATAIAAFALVLAAAEQRGDTTRIAIGAAIAAAGIAPLVENVSLLSVAVAATALAAAALWLNASGRESIAAWAAALGAFFVTGLGRFPIDMVRWRQAALRVRSSVPRGAGLLLWIMPLGLTFVFLLLFAQANPLIEQALRAIDLIWLLEQVDIGRVLFWCFMALASWPFLKPYLPRRRVRKVAADAKEKGPAGDPAPVSLIFGPEAITRALMSFNVLFAVQSVLDIAYLWGGVALPDGMTHAEYAHRGAYPLIVTALLAAAFVLLAMRPGSETHDSPLIRALVYAWVGQNVLLVISSILRLDLYVSVYSLTYWRIAAFIWMALVAGGLCLIMARIALRLSNEWLVSANLGVAAVVLYGCTFINFAAIIAGWNVAHAAQYPNDGRRKVDVHYLGSLGVQALPATRRLLDGRYLLTRDDRIWLEDCVTFWTGRLDRQRTDWRAWSWRGWRLSNDLGASYDNAAAGAAADSRERQSEPATEQPQPR